MASTEQVVNPSKGSALAEIAMASVNEVELAVTADAQVFPCPDGVNSSRGKL